MKMFESFLLFWLFECPFLSFSYFLTRIRAFLSWRHLKILHFEETIKGTSTGTYAWHQGTPNGPIKPFAVFARHNLNVPEKCQLASHAKLSFPMSYALGTEHINPCRNSICVRHTLEAYTQPQKWRALASWTHTPAPSLGKCRESDSDPLPPVPSVGCDSPHQPLKWTRGGNLQAFPLAKAHVFNSS